MHQTIKFSSTFLFALISSNYLCTDWRCYGICRPRPIFCQWKFSLFAEIYWTFLNLRPIQVINDKCCWCIVMECLFVYRDVNKTKFKLLLFISWWFEQGLNLSCLKVHVLNLIFVLYFLFTFCIHCWLIHLFNTFLYNLIQQIINVGLLGVYHGYMFLFGCARSKINKIKMILCISCFLSYS